MKKHFLFPGIILFFLVSVSFLPGRHIPPEDDRFLTYIVNPREQDLRFYWKDDKGAIFRSIGNLKNWLEEKKRTLVFAMNGGMYTTDRAPLGLYIEEGRQLKRLNTYKGKGNFYLMPNGVFYLRKNGTTEICQTKDFKSDGNIRFATQSGPLLLIDGNIYPAFTKGSVNLNIRNGVGILPDNRVVFVLSRSLTNFYDFATYFKSLGCKYALYLDGFVSRAYLPEKDWEQTGGNFGVLMAVSEEAR